MKKTAIEFFEGSNRKELQKEVNSFIEERDIKDIKYSVYNDVTTVMVIYYYQTRY